MNQVQNRALRVSVIVPVYKVEDYIRRCAESLFSQTWEDIQFIFVDDGSPDRSMEILNEVLESHPERKDQVIIIQESNKGLPGARMAGLSKATGDYIIHVDSDDWVEPDFISTLASAALETGADVVYCDFIKEYRLKPSKICREKDLDPSEGKTAVRAILDGSLKAYMWNKLERRTLYHLDSMVVPVKGYHEDIVFQCQILYEAGDCVHVQKPLYHYRRRRKGAITSEWHLRRKSEDSLNMQELFDARPEIKSYYGKRKKR